MLFPAASTSDTATLTAFGKREDTPEAPRNGIANVEEHKTNLPNPSITAQLPCSESTVTVANDMSVSGGGQKDSQSLRTVAVASQKRKREPESFQVYFKCVAPSKALQENEDFQVFIVAHTDWKLGQEEWESTLESSMEMHSDITVEISLNGSGFTISRENNPREMQLKQMTTPAGEKLVMARQKLSGWNGEKHVFQFIATCHRDADSKAYTNNAFRVFATTETKKPMWQTGELMFRLDIKRRTLLAPSTSSASELAKACNASLPSSCSTSPAWSSGKKLVPTSPSKLVYPPVSSSGFDTCNATQSSSSTSTSMALDANATFTSFVMLTVLAASNLGLYITNTIESYSTRTTSENSLIRISDVYVDNEENITLFLIQCGSPNLLKTLCQELQNDAQETAWCEETSVEDFERRKLNYFVNTYGDILSSRATVPAILLMEHQGNLIRSKFVETVFQVCFENRDTIQFQFLSNFADDQGIGENSVEGSMQDCCVWNVFFMPRNGIPSESTEYMKVVGALRSAKDRANTSSFSISEKDDANNRAKNLLEKVLRYPFSGSSNILLLTSEEFMRQQHSAEEFSGWPSDLQTDWQLKHLKDYFQEQLELFNVTKPAPVPSKVSFEELLDKIHIPRSSWKNMLPGQKLFKLLPKLKDYIDQKGPDWRIALTRSEYSTNKQVVLTMNQIKRRNREGVWNEAGDSVSSRVESSCSNQDEALIDSAQLANIPLKDAAFDEPKETSLNVHEGMRNIEASNLMLQHSTVALAATGAAAVTLHNASGLPKNSSKCDHIFPARPWGRREVECLKGCGKKTKCLHVNDLPNKMVWTQQNTSTCTNCFTLIKRCRGYKMGCNKVFQYATKQNREYVKSHEINKCEFAAKDIAEENSRNADNSMVESSMSTYYRNRREPSHGRMHSTNRFP